MAKTAQKHARASRLPRLSFRGWSFLLAGALAVYAAVTYELRPMVFVAVFVIALPLAGLLYVLIPASPVRFTFMALTERVEVGDQVEVSVVVDSPFPSLVYGAALWRLPLGRIFAETHWNVLSSVARGRGGASANDSGTISVIKLVACARGEHSFPAPQLIARDPFGLATRALITKARGSIIVFPRLVSWSEENLRQLDSAQFQRVITSNATVGERDVLARPYISGDEKRAIHWPSTARHNQLMVRQSSHPHAPTHELTLLVADSASSVHPRSNDEAEQSNELAISIASSIVVHWLSRGSSVTFTAGAQVQRYVANCQNDFLTDVAAIDVTSDGSATRPARGLSALSVVSADALTSVEAMANSAQGVLYLAATQDLDDEQTRTVRALASMGWQIRHVRSLNELAGALPSPSEVTSDE